MYIYSWNIGFQHKLPRRLSVPWGLHIQRNQTHLSEASKQGWSEWSVCLLFCWPWLKDRQGQVGTGSGWFRLHRREANHRDSLGRLASPCTIPGPCCHFLSWLLLCWGHSSRVDQRSCHWGHTNSQPIRYYLLLCKWGLTRPLVSRPLHLQFLPYLHYVQPANSAARTASTSRHLWRVLPVVCCSLIPPDVK